MSEDPTIAYIANYAGHGVAHLREDCRSLANRPSWLPAPSPVSVAHVFAHPSSAQPHWLAVRIVKNATVVVVSLRVCRRCANG